MSNALRPSILANIDEHPRFGLCGSERQLPVNILGQEVLLTSRIEIAPSAYKNALRFEQANEYMLSIYHCVSVFAVQAAEPIFFHSMDRYKRLRNTLWMAACPPVLVYVAHLLKLNGFEVREREDVNTALESIVFQSDDPEAKVTILELRRVEGRIENDEGGLIL